MCMYCSGSEKHGSVGVVFGNNITNAKLVVILHFDENRRFNVHIEIKVF